jgi:hypothetical protein
MRNIKKAMASNKRNTNHPPITHKRYESKWVTVTYYSPDMRIITKLFKNINIKTTIKTTNTITNIGSQ